ncbi:transposase IS111A/IS1328/IS1533 [Streptococcus pneumoniae GA56113]|nr:transposase IS111A/IS1328/IS1533 [Streptococcus pneumoniae GA56113]
MLQIAFPEIKNLLSTPTGEQYWNLVTIFPTKHWRLKLSVVELKEAIVIQLLNGFLRTELDDWLKS